MAQELALLEDRPPAGAALALPASNRVLYVVSGDAEVSSDGKTTALTADHAWQGAASCTVRARSDSRIWRWELRRDGSGARGASESAHTTVKLARGIDLKPADYLMRCDRVDFPPGGIAYTHTHQGPGIRVLLHGRFRVETGGHTLAIAPGEPWFESGPDAVYAEAFPEEPTSFVRVMILPRSLLGKSSIRYVKPEDQDRPKSQTYTVFVDAPITA